MASVIDHPDATTAGRPITGRRVLLSLAVWIVASALIGTVTILALNAVAPHWDPGVGPVVAVVAEVYLLLSVILLRVFGPAALAIRVPRRRDLGLTAGAFLAGSAVTFGLYWALSVATGWSLRHTFGLLVHAVTDVDRLPTASALTLALIIVRAGLLVGVAEELLFRGALYGWLRRSLAPTTAILITTAIFVVTHARPIAFPAVAAYGLALGWLRLRTDSNVTTIILHMLGDIGMLIIAATMFAGHAT